MLAHNLETIKSNSSEIFINNIEKKEELLTLLPKQLRDRWENSSIKEIEGVIKKRKEMGYEKIIGYHVSNKDLKTGSLLKPDINGEVFYSDNLKNLYGKYGGGYIYIIEGTADDTVIDENLGWKTIKGKMQIIDKIKITPENMENLGATFAKCEYH